MKVNLQHIHSKDAIEAKTARLSARASVLANQRSLALKLLIGLTVFAALVLAGAVTWVDMNIGIGIGEQGRHIVFFAFYVSVLAAAFSTLPFTFYVCVRSWFTAARSTLPIHEDIIWQLEHLAVAFICSFLVSTLIELGILMSMDLQSNLSTLELYAIFCTPFFSTIIVFRTLLYSIQMIHRKEN